MRCLGLLVLVASMARAEDPAHQAARERQERFKRLEIVLRRVDDVRRGAATELMAAMVKPGTELGTFPAEDTRNESVNRLVVDGKRIRWENRHPIFSETSKTFVNIEIISVSDAKLGKSLTDNFSPRSSCRSDRWQRSLSEYGRHQP